MHDLTRNAPSTDDLDKAFRAALGKMTGGLSTLPYTNAWADWAHQLSNSPGRQSELQQDAIARTLATFQFAARAMSGQPVPPNEGLPGAPDSRYAAPAWSQYPFNVWAHAFQQGAGWWQSLNQGVDGLPSSQADLVGFTVQQWLEALAPANFLASNPELLELTRAEGGENLRRGLQNYLEDTGRTMKGLGPVGTEGFQLGVNIAATPGKVVLQNELIELIQYSPTTADVYAEPILIVPAWIMKYYILDLSAKNSLVKYLVDQGHTVFMVSWKNPQPSDRDCDMDTYLKLGLRASLAAVSALVPEQKIHTVGYCIGGTLLAIGAAALGRENDHRIASVTLLAAQTDFSEPGELSLFINPSQLAMLEAKMREEGVLDSKQMGGAFQMLRPRDLIWQPLINTYLKGQREPIIDLMAWNADGTRMPWKMHTEYLYRLYLDNELASGRFPVEGSPVQLSDIRVPLFVVGTETDHVAPWKSVYKIGQLVRSEDYTFLLTSGGHNAGIISGPVHPKRRHRIRRRAPTDPHLAPADWITQTPPEAGSWWPVWQEWITAHSGKRVAPPKLGSKKAGYPVIGDAPGEYVRVR